MSSWSRSIRRLRCGRRERPAELERAFDTFYVTDEDLDALAGLRLVAEAV